MRTLKPVADRFWAKVDKNGPIPAHCPELGACWVWTGGCKTVRGLVAYGELNVAGAPESSHRISYRLRHGAIPKGKHILHHCDNKLCVNPLHLYAGTESDNGRDKYTRGQWTPPDNRGEKHPLAKLTQVEVDRIRKLHGELNADQVAVRFKVSRYAIEDVWYGRSWQIQQEETK
jgi:hypothetical protein